MNIKLPEDFRFIQTTSTYGALTKAQEEEEAWDIFYDEWKWPESDEFITSEDEAWEEYENGIAELAA
jgi:hypothetical protein